MNLSRNFTLEEWTRTSTGLPNTPTHFEIDKGLYLHTYIMQPIRDKWGVIRETSGFRSFGVNERVNGSIHSQHLKGEAVDFQAQADLKIIYNWITASDIQYGQLIYEVKGDAAWIHISLPRMNKPNRQNLSIINGVRKVITAPLEV